MLQIAQFTLEPLKSGVSGYTAHKAAKGKECRDWKLV